VPIEQGRTINLVCLGEGSPAVVITPGLGHWSWWWWSVQLPLAKRTRVCAWDRAGYGFSSPSPEPQDIIHTTADLERALKNAGIAGPYVMVGHSLGAFESLRFTDLHRENVIGMVLVDPDIPDRAAVEERLVPQLAGVWQALDPSMQQRLDCAAGLRSGTVKSGTPEFARCTAAPGVPDLFPRLQAVMARLNADPARLLTQASTEREHYASARQVINAHRHYGNMPLIVLTAGRDESVLLSSLSALPPGTPGAGTPGELAQLREQVVRFIREGWGPAHDAYAALSTRGRNQLVPDSGHNVIVEKPAVVISAINEVLDDARASGAGH
jgi:pimeloyl-ACP methyl ester carboxylesterase